MSGSSSPRSRTAAGATSIAPGWRTCALRSSAERCAPRAPSSSHIRMEGLVRGASPHQGRAVARGRPESGGGGGRSGLPTSLGTRFCAARGLGTWGRPGSRPVPVWGCGFAGRGPVLEGMRRIEVARLEPRNVRLGRRPISAWRDWYAEPHVIKAGPWRAAALRWGWNPPTGAVPGCLPVWGRGFAPREGSGRGGGRAPAPYQSGDAVLRAAGHGPQGTGRRARAAGRGPGARAVGPWRPGAAGREARATFCPPRVMYVM